MQGGLEWEVEGPRDYLAEVQEEWEMSRRNKGSSPSKGAFQTPQYLSCPLSDPTVT